jgi:hypothetical protein
MLKTVKFKRFCEILLVQVDEGASAHKVDWSPIVDKLMRPLECRTPRKVKFQDKTVTESLEDLGWMDVMPRGDVTLAEDSDPAFDYSLRNNQLAINFKLMRITV